MILRFLAALVLSVLPVLAAENDSPRKHPSQKEMREEFRTEAKREASAIQPYFDDHVKIASDPKEHSERRRGALEKLGHSRDPRAAKVLVKLSGDSDKAVAQAALNGMWMLARGLSDDPGKQYEVRKEIEPKVKTIAARDVKDDLDSASSAVAIFDALGDQIEAVELAKKVLSAGRKTILRQFVFWDESTEPSAFRIAPAAKGMFVEATATAFPDETRLDAAAFLGKAGNPSDAVPVLRDLVKNSKDRILRYKAMDELRAIGDDASRAAVREMIGDPELGKSANHLLIFWDKRPKK